MYAITFKWNLKNKLVNTAKINRLIDTENKLVFTVRRGMAKGARWGRGPIISDMLGVIQCLMETLVSRVSESLLY